MTPLLASDSTALRAAHAADPHRPRYHFCAPSHWLNDPNGLFFWRGAYHLFYQYNPFGAFHGHVHWGHAISRDLVTWRDLPIALTPTPDGYDQGGCWSGCMVDHDGVPTLLYTSVFPQTQSIATSDDPDLASWTKYPGNPVIAGIPDNLPIVGGALTPDIRDPWVWRDGDHWYMILGTGIEGVGGAALLYRSSDLYRWEYLHPLHSGQIVPGATIWECPNFFPLDGAHVLLLSELPEARYTYYQTGTYADLRFTPHASGRTDQGRYFYAAQTMQDDRGRRLMWGWLKEGRSVAAHTAAGWAGAMTVPRLLTVRDGLLHQAPAPELQTLRGAVLYDRRITLEPGELVPIASDARHAELVITADAQAIFAVSVLSSPDAAEETLIDYDHSYRTLLLSSRRSSLDPAIPGDAITVDYEPDSATVTLRIFIDGSIVEVFVDDTIVMTTRAYPTRADSSGIVLYGTDMTTEVTCTVWAMGSIFLAEAASSTDG
ncbi:MAG: glycoside hydrolase family 32 protein [Chloroflexota bacterium]|nr:glycoside hydrolase family 32 protein [Chloroflexota bacterium]